MTKGTAKSGVVALRGISPLEGETGIPDFRKGEGLPLQL